MATGMVGLPPFTSETAAKTGAAESLLNRREARAEQAMQVRLRAAEAQRKLALPPQPVNGDEDLYPNRIGSFTKGLPHNELGEVNLRAYESLLQALKTSKQEDYELIPLGGAVKLANPQAALSFEMAGTDPHYLSMSPPPAFNSAEQAAEMIELYWHALTRDINFSDYHENHLTNQAAFELSTISGYRGPKNGGRVTPGYLFRGNTPGDLTGPYLSQFLLMDIPYGAMIMQQRYRPPQAENDHMKSYEEWLSIQNGVNPISIWSEDLPRYLRNGNRRSIHLTRISVQPLKGHSVPSAGHTSSIWSRAWRTRR
jgi:hypothetical protein